MHQSIIQDEIHVDNFAGGGGVSVGFKMVFGKSFDIAINHDHDAIAMYKTNHKNTELYCESVWDVNPQTVCKGRRVGVVWFSPDCKHFSKAAGGKPLEKKIRGLAWVAVRWALSVSPRIIHLENVAEFLTWGPLDNDGKPIKERLGETFEGFVHALTQGLSPRHASWLEAIRALDIEFNLPEKLKLYRGAGYKLDHKMMTASDMGAGTTRERFFLIARNDNRPITWANPTHVNPKIKPVLKKPAQKNLKPWRTAAECIDWSIPCKSIFNRPKPIVDKSLQRIAKAINQFVFETDSPFIAPKEARIVPYQTAQHRSNRKPLQADHSRSFIASHIVKYRGRETGIAMDEPLHTITAGGLHFAEVRVFLVKYYGRGVGQALHEPLHTIRTADCFGLVMFKGTRYKIIDIGLRMLEPHELFLASSFPSDYVINVDYKGNKYSKAKQVARCGNAVPPLLAKAVIAANYFENPDFEQVA